jgi:hypothetical protein
MILTLQDDGVLRVYKSVDDAVGDVEALDAEETFQAVFDDSGEAAVARDEVYRAARRRGSVEGT